MIPEQLDTKIEKAVQRSRTSKGAWVRKAVEDALERRSGKERGGTDSLNGPTADIDEMLAPPANT